MKPSEVQFAKNLEALKSPQCRRIVAALNSGALTISELSQNCNLTQGSIEKHIEILNIAELLHSEEANDETKYSLNLSTFLETLDWFKDLGK